VTQSDEYIQLESSQEELPARYQDFDGNNYIQLYDERGSPINPRARDYGKKLRNAQNDVLAAVGVVERRRSPSERRSGAYEQRLDALDVEDTAGNALAVAVTLAENGCTWWIGTIRDRLLVRILCLSPKHLLTVQTFRYPDATSFAQIVASEYKLSSRSIMHAGFMTRIFSTICSQTILYSVLVYRPWTRLLQFTGATSKVHKLFRRSRYALVLRSATSHMSETAC
jgi:hypothetical protein